jgi:hypothetical protein
VLVPPRADPEAADAGISAKVEDLVKKDAIPLRADSRTIAVRLGGGSSRTWFSPRSWPQAREARGSKIEEGFALLGAGQDIGKTIDDISARLVNDAINSDDLARSRLSRVLVLE